MDNSIGKVIIADKNYSNKVEQLRRISYHNSENFQIVNDEVFDKYCKWTNKDSKGIVLLALNNQDEPLSTMRGNIYYNQSELENDDVNFKHNSTDFIMFPTLNMTFAATSPTVFKSGLNSVLRYYFYFLHRHCVKSILGTGIYQSSIYKTLEYLNYEFKFITHVRDEIQGKDKTFIAKLSDTNFDNAIDTVYKKYQQTINKFPLIVA